MESCGLRLPDNMSPTDIIPETDAYETTDPTGFALPDTRRQTRSSTSRISKVARKSSATKFKNVAGNAKVHTGVVHHEQVNSF